MLCCYLLFSHIPFVIGIIFLSPSITAFKPQCFHSLMLSLIFSITVGNSCCLLWCSSVSGIAGCLMEKPKKWRLVTCLLVYTVPCVVVFRETLEWQAQTQILATDISCQQEILGSFQVLWSYGVESFIDTFVSPLVSICYTWGFLLSMCSCL